MAFEALGAVSSIIAILQLSGKICKYIQGVRGADESRKLLLNTLSSIQELLQKIDEDIKAGKLKEDVIQILASSNGPLMRIKNIFSMVQVKLEPKEGRSDLFQKLKWPFSEKEVISIVQAMDREFRLLSISLTNITQQLTQENAKVLGIQTDLLGALKSTIGSNHSDTIGEMKTVRDQNEIYHQDLMQNFQTLEIKRSRNDQRDERREILDWLSPKDYATTHSDISNQRVLDTGTWFLESEPFQNWLKNGGTILCEGMPGAGKTVITSLVIDSLQEHAKQEQGICLAFSYLAHSHQNLQTTTSILSSILRQVMANRHDIPASLSSLYKDGGRTDQKLFQALLDALEDVPKTFIIMDAFDECEQAYKKPIMSKLIDLQLARPVSILATSRQSPNIRSLLSPNYHIEIRASDQDLNRYLDHHLSRFEDMEAESPGLLAHAKNVIIKSADGMFMLVKLCLNQLEEEMSVHEFREELERFSAGSWNYEEAYDAVMSRITRQKPRAKALALHVLSWITYARRPLTAIELQHAVAVKAGTSQFDKLYMHSVEKLLSACVGLVVLSDESCTVRLVHHTTEEYLRNRMDELFPRVETNITTACLTYLSFQEFASGPCRSLGYQPGGLSHRIQQYPFYLYAARNFGYHAKHVPNLARDFAVFFMSSNHINASAQALNISQDWKWAGLHLAVYFGLEMLFNDLLDSNSSLSGSGINCTTGRGYTPLHIAVEQNQIHMLSVILSHNDLDPNLRDVDGISPLHVAAWNGNAPAIECLLQHSSIDLNIKSSPSAKTRARYVQGIELVSGEPDPSFKGTFGSTLEHFEFLIDPKTRKEQLYLAKNGRVPGASGYTAIHFALRSGSIKVVEILTKAGAELELGRLDKNGTILHHCSEFGSERSLEFLIQQGIQLNTSNDLRRTVVHCTAQSSIPGLFLRFKQIVTKDELFNDSKDKFGRTPLSHAVESGNVEMCRFLLDNGADITTVCNSGRNLLSYSSSNKCETTNDIILLLRQRCGNADSKCSAGRLPIHYAAMNGNIPALEYWISANDDVYATCSAGLSALIYAARHGKSSAVKKLLGSGYHIDSACSLGRTSLSYAVERGSYNTVQVLLESGAKVDKTCLEGKSPLMYGDSNFNCGTFELLCNYGADLDKTSFNDRTALSYAAQRGSLVLAGFLIIKGVAMDKKCAKGRTALSYAAEKGNVNMLRGLLDHGARADIRCIEDRLAIEYAISSGHKDAAEILSVPSKAKSVV